MAIVGEATASKNELCNAPYTMCITTCAPGVIQSTPHHIDEVNKLTTLQPWLHFLAACSNRGAFWRQSGWHNLGLVKHPCDDDAHAARDNKGQQASVKLEQTQNARHVT